MIKFLKADKDSYITNRFIKGNFTHNSNVGAAGTLDLFKLYGQTLSSSNPNTELSRLLIHYDLEPLKELFANNKININDSSFKCYIKLHDVYGGQPTPSNFQVCVNPLSRSFEEGKGKDVVYYEDYDVCNFISSSRDSGDWYGLGCTSAGDVPGVGCDYITSSMYIDNGSSLTRAQLFKNGDEDLNIDVTTIVSATLAGILPDEGFRVSFSESIENDNRSYFVKRFGSRSVYNESKRPRLIIKYDDSTQDDTQALYFDTTNTLFLRNYYPTNYTYSNLLSGSPPAQIVNDNCVLLKLETNVSDGLYTKTFVGSQYKVGNSYVVGVYYVNFNISSTEVSLSDAIIKQGFVKFTPVWYSTDGTFTYLTGSELTVKMPSRTGSVIDNRKLLVSVYNVQESYLISENPVIRVHLQDETTPQFIATRLPIEKTSVIYDSVHYQVRDVGTNTIEIPFDDEHNSTRISSDINGMYFQLDMSNFLPNHSYVIDIMVTIGDNKQIYKSVSSIFRVTA